MDATGAHFNSERARDLDGIAATVKWLRENPKERNEMLQLSEKDHDTQCHARAKVRGQRTFTLVEQDLTTPEVICEWIKLNIKTCGWNKLLEALQSAYMIAQESKVVKKAAD